MQMDGRSVILLKAYPPFSSAPAANRGITPGVQQPRRRCYIASQRNAAEPGIFRPLRICAPHTRSQR